MRHSLSSSCALLFAALLPLAGCAVSNTSSTAPTTPSQSSSSITGNWQGSLVATAGTAPLTAFAGSFSQNGSQSSAGQYTTAVLHVSGPCFVDSPLLPLQGNNSAGTIGLDSYTVNGQSLHLSSTASATGSTMQGTYTVAGGCANGASGTFTASRVAPLTGTFTGTVAAGSSAGPGVSLALSQAADTTGSGTFLLTGSLTLAGTGCSLSAAAPAAEASYAQGSSLNVQFAATDGSGAAATLVGTADLTGKHIAPLHLTVQGGTCAGTYTAGTLTRP